METLSSRVMKFVVGSVLIIAPMTAVDSTTLGNSVLLPLLGIPIVFSGMFNWRPMDYILAGLVRVLRITPDKIKLTPTGAV